MNRNTSIPSRVICEYYIEGNRVKSQLTINQKQLDVYTLEIGKEYYIVNSLSELISKSIEKKISTQKNKINPLKKLKKKEIILGYSCTVYKEKRLTPFGRDVVYYSIADSLKAGNLMSSGMIKNGRIVLKFVQKTDRGSYETEAIEINKMKFDDDFFELPDYPIKEVDFEKLSKQYIYQASH